MSEMDVEHLAYVTDRHYRRRVEASLKRAVRLLGRVLLLKVHHEGDWICCQLEDWPVTVERINQLLQQDGPPAWVFTEVRP